MDRPVLIAFGFIVVLLVLGGVYNRQFLSRFYLLQQLQVASFLGIIASGADGRDPARTHRPVDPLGGHDRWDHCHRRCGLVGRAWTALGVPIAIACGALVGLANGLGVAFLRIPSMVFTLGMNAVVQGMVVMYTGGNAPANAEHVPLVTNATIRMVRVLIPDRYVTRSLFPAA